MAGYFGAVGTNFYIKMCAISCIAIGTLGCSKPEVQEEEISENEEFRVFHGFHTDYGTVFCRAVWVRGSTIHTMTEVGDQL